MLRGKGAGFFPRRLPHAETFNNTTVMASGPATLPAGLGSFEVNVKDFHGHSVVISVNPRWNVAAVKQRISENTGVPPQDYNLVFAGTPLADSLTLMVGAARRRARLFVFASRVPGLLWSRRTF